MTGMFRSFRARIFWAILLVTAVAAGISLWLTREWLEERQLDEARTGLLREARVALLGVSYKRDVADTRESPAFAVASRLLRDGAHVRYHDPHVQEFTVDGTDVSRVDGLADALGAADLAIVLQDHSCYGSAELAESGCPVLDTRGRLSGENVTTL